MQEQERKHQRRDSAEDSESECESEKGFEGAAGNRADQHSQGIGEVKDRIGRTESHAMTALADGCDRVADAEPTEKATIDASASATGVRRTTASIIGHRRDAEALLRKLRIVLK